MFINDTALKKENKFKLDTHPAITTAQIICSHEKFGQFRGLIQNDGLWVVAKDIAASLGYSDTNAMTRHLDDDESMSVKLTGMNMPHTIINEAGLYSAIIRSRVEGAKKFKRWITHEILPSIRTKGFYTTDNFIDNILANPNEIIAFLKKFKDERKRRQLAEHKMEEAIQTINSQKALIKKCKKLVWEPHTWVPIGHIPWLIDFFNMNQSGCRHQIGKRLSIGSRRLGLNPRLITHPKLGTVNLYHNDVIQMFHNKLIKDQNLMRKYRKY